jgi:hypothetical protein
MTLSITVPYMVELIMTLSKLDFIMNLSIMALNILYLITILRINDSEQNETQNNFVCSFTEYRYSE